MLFSSSVAISQAVYNLPRESYNYQNCVKGPLRCGNADLAVKVNSRQIFPNEKKEKKKNMKPFFKLYKTGDILTFTDLREQ